MVARGAGLAGLHAALAALRTDLPWARWRVAALLGCRLLLLAAVAPGALRARRLPRVTDRVELLVLADQSASIGPGEGKRRGIGSSGPKRPRHGTAAGS